MFLFIDAISTDGVLILFENNNIKSNQGISIKGKESELLLDKIDEFIKSNNLDFKDLSGIVVVNGPGSFTGTRIISLVVNTINFLYKTPLDSIDYFSLMEYMNNSYPMVIKANRGEYLVKKSENHKSEIIAIGDLEKGDYTGIGDKIDFEKNKSSIQLKKDYKKFIEKYEFNGENIRIEPFYIKKPNITI